MTEESLMEKRIKATFKNKNAFDRVVCVHEIKKSSLLQAETARYSLYKQANARSIKGHDI